MTPLAFAGLAFAGLSMGAINNLAGAGGVIGLFALVEAAGLSPAAANGSLRLAALAIGLSGWLGFESRRRRAPARAWLYGLLAAPGAAAGAALVVVLPAPVYQVALAAVLALVLAQQLRPVPLLADARTASPFVAALTFTLVGTHMGFLQVGVGLFIMAALTATYDRDLVAVNTAKMPIVIVTATVSVASLAFAGAVHWPAAIVLAAGASAGSFLASRWSVRRGHRAVRAVVLVITSSALVWCVLQLVRQLGRGS